MTPTNCHTPSARRHCRGPPESPWKRARNQCDAIFRNCKFWNVVTQTEKRNSPHRKIYFVGETLLFFLFYIHLCAPLHAPLKFRSILFRVERSIVQHVNLHNALFALLGCAIDFTARKYTSGVINSKLTLSDNKTCLRTVHFTLDNLRFINAFTLVNELDELYHIPQR